MVTTCGNYAEFQRLTLQLIEIVLAEKNKIIQLHSDYFVRNFNNFKHSHKRLITEFTLNSYDNEHKTLLHKAVKFGNAKLVHLLVGYYKALVNTCDIFGNTPLFSAIKSNHINLAKYLIKRGAILNYNELKDITNCNSGASLTVISLFNFILNHLEQNESLRSLNNQAPICGGALHLAITKRSNVTFLEFLLKKGADPNEMNKYGLTPIHLAASSSSFYCNSNLVQYQNDSVKNLKILQTLYKFNGDLNKTSSCGLIPLNMALISSNNLNCIKFLFSKTKPASLNIVDEWDFTSLDRLWYRMNNFKLLNKSNQSSVNAFENKLKLTAIIKSYQALLKEFILTGAQANKFLMHPQKFSYNYFIISNLTALLKLVLVFQRPLIDCPNKFDTSSFKMFLAEAFTFLIEKLAIKFSFLVKRRINFYISQHLNWNSENPELLVQFRLFEIELNEFKSEFTQFKEIIEIMLTGGHLITNIPLMSSNNELIQNIFCNYFSTKQIDLDELCMENPDLSDGFRQNLDILLDLDKNDVLKSINLTILDYRKQMLAHVYLSFMNKVKKPLTLQELCRFQIRVSAKNLNEKLRENNFGLSKNLRNFLIYE